MLIAYRGAVVLKIRKRFSLSGHSAVTSALPFLVQSFMWAGISNLCSNQSVCLPACLSVCLSLFKSFPPPFPYVLFQSIAYSALFPQLPCTWAPAPQLFHLLGPLPNPQPEGFHSNQPNFPSFLVSLDVFYSLSSWTYREHSLSAHHLLSLVQA